MLRTVCTIAGAFSIAIGLTATPTYAQPIEPEADKILHAMANYVAELKSFTVNYEAESEVVDVEAQKLQYSASGSVAVERPGKLHVSRKGTFIDAELTFDGKTISIYAKKANVYGQLETPGPTIDDAVEEVRAATGFDAPGADLFATDSYAVLTEDATKGVYVGRPGRRDRVRPPCLPQPEGRLADLGSEGRTTAAAQICHYDQMDYRRATILAEAQRLGHGAADRTGAIHVQSARRCQEA
jgi:Predicted periplasmic protein (DUF2092)